MPGFVKNIRNSLDQFLNCCLSAPIFTRSLSHASAPRKSIINVNPFRMRTMVRLYACIHTYTVETISIAISAGMPVHRGVSHVWSWRARRGGALWVHATGTVCCARYLATSAESRASAVSFRCSFTSWLVYRCRR